MLLVPRDISDASTAATLRCLAAVLRLWRDAPATPVHVCAALHRGVVTFEADWLWDVANASTMRVLTAGSAALEVAQVCGRAAAGTARASAEGLRGAWDAAEAAGFACSETSGGEVLLRLAGSSLPEVLLRPMASGAPQRGAQRLAPRAFGAPVPSC